MKKAFSLLELIFVIIIIGIIASIAVPKYVDTRDSAVISTVKRDLNTIITSTQVYYLTNGNILKFSDAVNLNQSNWTINEKKIIDKSECLTLELKIENDSKRIELSVDSTKNGICKKMRESNIISTTYDLT